MTVNKTAWVWLVAQEGIALELSPVELFLIRDKQVSANGAKKMVHRITTPMKWALLSITWAAEPKR